MPPLQPLGGDLVVVQRMGRALVAGIEGDRRERRSPSGDASRTSISRFSPEREAARWTADPARCRRDREVVPLSRNGTTLEFERKVLRDGSGRFEIDGTVNEGRPFPERHPRWRRWSSSRRGACRRQPPRGRSACPLKTGLLGDLLRIERRVVLEVRPAKRGVRPESGGEPGIEDVRVLLGIVRRSNCQSSGSVPSR